MIAICLHGPNAQESSVQVVVSSATASHAILGRVSSDAMVQHIGNAHLDSDTNDSGSVTMSKPQAVGSSGKWSAVEEAVLEEAISVCGCGAQNQSAIITYVRKGISRSREQIRTKLSRHKVGTKTRC